MRNLFLVLGTDGAGKTAAMKGVRSAKTVNMGSELHKYYLRKFGVDQRDRIRVAQLTSYLEALKSRREVIRRIARMGGKVAIDTHAFVKAGDGYMPGLSLADMQILKGRVGAIVYIDADSKQIIRRRRQDNASTVRSREKDSREELDRERSINLMFATQFAMYLDAPVYIVRNDDGMLEQAQRRVEQIMKEVK